MTCRWQVEQDRFKLATLKTHWPETPKYEDIQECGTANLEAVDCITAGVPCQDVSVAGRRAGLKGERTGLFYEFARILCQLRPTWFVFENVPGLFSSNGGRDFAEVQRVLMVECGYGISWRVLNSRFFGVAQRRRRVYVVGSLGKPCPGEVLFEEEGGVGNPAKGEEARAEVAAAVTCGVGRVGSRGADDGANIVQQAISKKWSKGTSGPAGDEHHNLVASTLRAQDGPHGASDRGDGQTNLVVAATLNAREGYNDPPGDHLAIDTNYVGAPPDADRMRDFAGLPKGMDSPRYRALGDAVTVQVAEWIGRRIVSENHSGRQSQ